jgi:hypothetical protein
MPRQPRLNIADGVYHVTQRGIERRNIVREDRDRHEWFRLLDRYTAVKSVKPSSANSEKLQPRRRVDSRRSSPLRVFDAR